MSSYFRRVATILALSVLVAGVGAGPVNPLGSSVAAAAPSASSPSASAPGQAVADAAHARNAARQAARATAGSVQDLALVAVGTTFASYTWTPVKGAGSYQVSWAFPGGAPLGSFTVTAAEATVAGLLSGTDYVVSVAAVKGRKVGTASTITTTTLPDAPSVTAGPVTSTTASISWDAVRGGTSYVVQTSGDGVSWSASVGVTELTFSSTGLAPDTTVFYRVAALNRVAGQGEWSAPLPVRTAPAAPTLRVEEVTSSTVTLAWDSVSGAERYEVSSSRDGSVWGEPVAAVSPSLQSGLEAASEYYYRVRAIGPAGTGDWSAAVKCTTLPAANLESGVVAPFPASNLTDAGTVTVDGKVYIFGGREFGRFPYHYAMQGHYAMRVFDPATETYTTLASTDTSAPFYRPSLVELGGKIYVVGGSSYSASLPSATRVMKVYDIATNTWTSGPPLPVAAAEAPAVALGGKIFVFSTTGIQIFTPSTSKPGTGTWATTSVYSPGARGSAVVVGNKVYLMNPVFHNTGNPTGNLFVFTPNATFTSGSWSTIYVPYVYELRNGSSYSTLSAVGTRLYLVGGAPTNTAYMPARKTGIVFDTATGTFTDEGAVTLGTPRQHHFSATVGSTVYVFGGQDAAPSGTRTPNGWVYYNSAESFTLG